MASIEYLILFLVGAALLAYLLSKFNNTLASIFTIFATMFVFASLAGYGFGMNLVTTVNVLPGFTFSQTYLGFYFAILIVFVYLMVSFFHPYYLSTNKYKDSYNLLISSNLTEPV